MSPASDLEGRGFDPFCERAVLRTIHDLADYSHSKAMADLVTAGKWKPEMLLTLGKVGLPRYAHFIGRSKDDPEPQVRLGVAAGLGLIDNVAITIPILIQLLTRGGADDFNVRWEAATALLKVARREGVASLRPRLRALLEEPDGMTALLAGRTLALAGDTTGLAKLRELSSDASAKVRQEALLALGQAGDRAARGVAIERLKDESVAVRACAIYALGMLRDPSLVPSLELAAREAIEYMDELQRQHGRGALHGALAERSGFDVYDPRETLREAIAVIEQR